MGKLNLSENLAPDNSNKNKVKKTEKEAII